MNPALKTAVHGSLMDITFGRLVSNRSAVLSAALMVLSMVMVGCGTTRGYHATEQLVMSEAVDRSIASIDFRPLSGRKVYLDTSYLRQVKGEGFVNSEYVTSALRQQIVAAGCLIQDANPDADIIIEARIGTLGTDDHRVTFGVPENNALASAVSLIPGSPNIPTIPEVALARRESREAAAKIAAFAYDRETRRALWQSGVESSLATAKDTWVLGVGPFQGGSVREQMKLAGSEIGFGTKSATGSPARFFDRPPVSYTAKVRFQEGWPVFDDGGVSADMIGVHETDVAGSEVAGSEVAGSETLEESDASDDGTEIATANEEPQNLQR